MKILIITGGKSAEREISLLSAAEVHKALKELKHFVGIFDHQEGYVRLGARVRDFDLVFPVLHGKEGEDGELYKFLHTLKVPHIGSNYKGAKIAFDKILFKKYCQKNNLPTARWKIVGSAQDLSRFGIPCVLKASKGGSSTDVAIIKLIEDLKSSEVKRIFHLKDQLFAEEFLDGTEITVGVLGEKVLPVVEIIPPEGEWFNYQNKYSGATKEIVGAPSIYRRTAQEAQKMALKIHQDLKLGPYSRTDMIVVNNQPVILEVNTPGGVGFTAESLFPKAAKAIGLEFKDLIHHLITSV